MKQCIKCNEILDENRFREQTYRGYKSFKNKCKKCESKERMARPYYPLSEEQKRKKNIRLNEYQKKKRRNPDNAAKIILVDSRSADKKKGIENNLTENAIAELIVNGCYYCGDKTTRMTLDRVDNNIGHVLDNILPACHRCNMIRGNMPFKAWECIVPAIKETFEKGLFENWVGGRIAYK